MVDFDPQSSLTISCGINMRNLQKSLYDAIARENEEEEEVNIGDIIIKTKIKDVNFLPSNIDLSGA
ncbi:unnamed protein product, partial [marine sediment metagenome]